MQRDRYTVGGVTWIFSGLWRAGSHLLVVFSSVRFESRVVGASLKAGKGGRIALESPCIMEPGRNSSGLSFRPVFQAWGAETGPNLV